ncbi:hypothetical protein CCMA1212_001288 [Trichoderma ghanense]|uniref:Uncharacterized protein n=1 Tax=Trichoderma ghanense TaxID=65468 RepID=A0ABY2HHN5_9HYPO
MRLLFRSTRDGSSCSYTNLRNKQNANSPGTYQTLCPGPRLRPKEYAPSQDPRSSSGAAIKVNVVYISCYDNVADITTDQAASRRKSEAWREMGEVGGKSIYEVQVSMYLRSVMDSWARFFLGVSKPDGIYTQRGEEQILHVYKKTPNEELSPVTWDRHCQVRLPCGKGLHPSTLAFGDSCDQAELATPPPLLHIACLTRLHNASPKHLHTHARTHTQSVAGL